MRVLYLGLALGLIVLVVALRFWATRGDETIDLRSPEARQSAAASFLIDGEAEQAEKMLSQAVAVLEGWDKALALADLASLLAATGRDAEAASTLEKAVALGGRAAAPSEELIELRVQMAQAYSRQGDIEKARSVLLQCVEDAEEELGKGLAEEAYAEFLVRHDELQLALPCYERACKRLAAADHDRAPIAVARYAHALLLDDASQLDGWRAMDALSHELQHAVPVALAHLAHSFEPDESLQLISTLLDKIGQDDHWNDERASLEALVRELSEERL